MGDNRDNRRQTRRISSILKNVVTSDDSPDSPTQTFSRRSKRISFSHVNNVKEFVAGVDNRTVWVDSYEKAHTGTNLSNSGSLSQAATINSVSQAAASNSIAVEPTIDLFADIEDESDEMEVSENESEAATKLFNQTMFIEETVTTSTTNCKLVDMSVFGNTNKRKTIETVSVDTLTTDVTKSVKIRKMNDENLEPEMPHKTILHHVNMSVNTDRKSVTKSQVNLNSTRIFEVDADITEVSMPQIKGLDKSSASSSEVRSSKMLDKTLVSTVDISIDAPHTASFASDTTIPAIQTTHIYGRGDISAGIDQTFAVRNPLQENNATVWKGADKLDYSEKQTSDSEVEPNVPSNQASSGSNRHRTLEDLTMSMDIQFENHSMSPHSLNPDEPVIEDLTIMLDTNFKAEVSGEGDDSAIQSMSRLTGSGSPNDSRTNHNSLRTEHLKTPTLNLIEPSTMLPSAESKERVSANGSAQLLHSQNMRNLTDLISKDLSLDPIGNVACREPIVLSTLDPTILYDSANDRPSKHKFLDYSTSHDQLPATDFSFAHSDPLSSTRFVPNNKCPLNFSNIDPTATKASCSSVTFNDCPTLTARKSQDMRSGTSLQNNTDELCNLEPDQLKKMSEMKKLFISLSREASSCSMLSETKMDLISITDNETANDEPKESGPSVPPNIAPGVAADHSSDASADIAADVHKSSRCRKCMNCRQSLTLGGGNATFDGLGPLNEPPKLDFSMYDQFKGLPTMRDVIDARKKREAARELEKQLLVDQNVEAPDIRLLWLNKNMENTVEPAIYVPEPLICFPMRMTIKYLMNNKMRTEYTQWKYNDNFFQIGAIAMRYNEIPSIRIHIKFDVNAPAKAEELNMPLLFNRVFIEQCPTYLNRISTGNLLKHNNAYGLLPTNLLSMISSSENIYRGLDEIERRFQSIIAKVNEFDALTVEHGALVRMETDGTCHVQKMFFDIENLKTQAFTIEFDKIDTVGPDNVAFDPYREITDAFKALPNGLPFLRSFLSDPKSYIEPLSDA